jgi:hypothetical protein
LHTHAVAANLTFDGAENRWKALQASPIYERRAYLPRSTGTRSPARSATSVTKFRTAPIPKAVISALKSQASPQTSSPGTASAAGNATRPLPTSSPPKAASPPTMKSPSWSASPAPINSPKSRPRRSKPYSKPASSRQKRPTSRRSTPRPPAIRKTSIGSKAPFPHSITPRTTSSSASLSPATTNSLPKLSATVEAH